MTPDYDIAILGAGPVGQALALLLARAARDPARIALLTQQDATPAGRGPAPPQAGGDPRSLALNHGSRVLLQSLQAWPARTAVIDNIHVSQRGRLGRVVIDRNDFDVPHLGYVTPYVDLAQALGERVARSGISLLAGERAGIAGQDTSMVTIAQGDRRFTAALAVASDGAAARGQDRGGAAPRAIRRDYDQHAVLATVRATRPRTGWAFERFTREGPLAVLPHPTGAGTHSIVWCTAPARAHALAALDAAAFSDALSQAFGNRLGPLVAESPRHVFPLELNARRQLVKGRTVAIGNAAQTLHPVAGQGLNLGLRDAFQLAQALGSWLTAPNLPPEHALSRFAGSRRVDRWLTAGLTDLMPRVFATGLSPIEHACGLALLALDTVAPIRAPLARHLLYGHRS